MRLWSDSKGWKSWHYGIITNEEKHGVGISFDWLRYWELGFMLYQYVSLTLYLGPLQIHLW